jgi:hypothetical protein
MKKHIHRHVPERRRVLGREVEALRHRPLGRLLLEGAQMEVAALLVRVLVPIHLLHSVLVTVQVRLLLRLGMRLLELVVVAVAHGLGLDPVRVLDVVGLLRRLHSRLLGLGVQVRRLLLDLLWGCVRVCVCVYMWGQAFTCSDVIYICLCVYVTGGPCMMI